MKTFLKFYENVDDNNIENYENLKLDREYETSLNDKECYIHQELDENTDILCQSAKIYWGIRINDEFNKGSETNKGISDLEIIVKKVVCEIIIEQIDGEAEPIEKTIIFEMKNIKTDIDINFESGTRISIYPLEIEIRYDDKECTVNF